MDESISNGVMDVKKEKSGPSWNVNDQYLFQSIDIVLKSGVQMSAIGADQTSKLKPDRL